MNSKPKVRYADVEQDVLVGMNVMVLPLDHPSELVSNETWVMTSPVIRVLYQSSNGPVFETQNSIYIPADDVTPVVRLVRTVARSEAVSL